MTLTLVLLAMGALAAGAPLTLLARGRDRLAVAVSSATSLLGCGVGLGAAIAALLRGDRLDLTGGWQPPLGSLHVGLDPLSAFFLTCLFLVAGLAALYGWGYLEADLGKRPLAAPAALFNLLVAAMAGVVVARDGVLFLVAWEVMSVASFLLVATKHERDEARRAGMTYLIASHLGAIFLFVLFALLADRAGGSFDFSAWRAAGAPGAALAGTCFLLALAGFGTKAGFWPVHIWLPDAYSAAPSHVSALMAVASKVSIYGLLRALDFLGPAPAWWGVTLIGVGLVSGLVGALHALAQNELKRLFAYCSVENIGLVGVGLGLGLLGAALDAPALAFLGFAGALLHALNHALFKSLLFQVAGSVLRATGTRSVDALGGLLKRMPATGAAFLVAALAISGLPPLNGFVSEWLIYLGAFQGSFGAAAFPAAVSAAALAGLALIGGLALATFVKAYGTSFLGAPRSPEAERATEANLPMKLGMGLSALLCLAIGAFPAGALALAGGPAAALAGLDPARAELPASLGAISRLALLLAAMVAALALLRARLLRGRDVREASTWGCGYPAPTARIQYTGASFSQPLLAPFALLLQRHVRLERPQGFFPASARAEERHGDLAGERLLVPAARRLVSALGRMRVLQHGKLHLYLVYVLFTLIALLAWQLATP